MAESLCTKSIDYLKVGRLSMVGSKDVSMLMDGILGDCLMGLTAQEKTVVAMTSPQPKVDALRMPCTV